MPHHSFGDWVVIIAGSALLILVLVRMAMRQKAAPAPLETGAGERMSDEEIAAEYGNSTDDEFIERIKAAKSSVDLADLFKAYPPQNFSRKEMLRFIFVAEGLRLTLPEYRTLSEVAAKALADDEDDFIELNEWIDLRARSAS